MDELEHEEEAAGDRGIPLSRIDALVRLLGDDDEKILAVAWDELERIGSPALPVLREASRSSGDERVRVQAQRYLVEWDRRHVFRSWIRFCRGGVSNLEEGVFLIARTEDPRCDVESYVARLDDHAAVLRRRLERERTVEGAVRRVASFLFVEEGYRGNVDGYDEADNSYLPRVLDRKLGIPISLSVLLLLVCERLSVPVQGVSTPGHFLVKFAGDSRELFVDAFHGGKILTLTECARVLAMARVRLREEDLEPASVRQILVRMLNNLFKIYWELDDERRSARVAAMLELLA